MSNIHIINAVRVLAGRPKLEISYNENNYVISNNNNRHRDSLYIKQVYYNDIILCQLKSKIQDNMNVNFRSDIEDYTQPNIQITAINRFNMIDVCSDLRKPGYITGNIFEIEINHAYTITTVKPPHYRYFDIFNTRYYIDLTSTHGSNCIINAEGITYNNILYEPFIYHQYNKLHSNSLPRQDIHINVINLTNIPCAIYNIANPLKYPKVINDVISDSSSSIR